MRTEENLPPNEQSIKSAWSAGTPSIRQIAKDHEVSEAWVRKLAKKHGWAARPKAGAQSSAQGRTLIIPPSRPAAAPPPSSTIEHEPKSNVEIAAEVDPEELAKEGIVVLSMILAEIKADSLNQGALDQAVEDLTAGDENPRRYNLLHKAVSAPTRAMAAKNIMLALQTAAALGPGKKAAAKAAAKELGTGRFATPPTPPAFKAQTMQ